MAAGETSLDVQTLYSDHHGWLQGWLRRKLGNAFDAADFAHDTFVRVLGKGPDQVVHEPRAYLATIAGGLVASHWRRYALEQAWLEALAARPEPLAPSPEERYLILETLEEIANLLDGLPAQVREAFLLSQLDGQTYPQIAAQLGISVNVVQKAMTRAVAHCYKALYATR
ncbi:RNA polymerase subunit sigma [Rubrivivax gelatinosus]|uniref:sigma-70 family RNA polymerase sigma factor n=1 Tax=Rubrivivax gelatinosus TaxID=28068 RepID=UPI0019048B3E|nr:sigma-70 family RNA polymerase sigma factor [Rubrivivax gelatinosus]MBK1613918.1 RNA polymerase subunit sigma [Rubrivivax gelatinosus]MBZ8143071.1 RNA polymerase subunit sigma [Rubrivivax gelatinosus]